MLGDRITKLLGQDLGEIGLEGAAKERIVGQVAGHQFVEHRHLGVGQYHRSFGGGQTLLAGASAGNFFVVGQELDGAIEPLGAFEPLHQALLTIEHVHRSVAGDVQRLRLVVVVGQDQVADFVGHGGQQVGCAA